MKTSKTVKKILICSLSLSLLFSQTTFANAAETDDFYKKLNDATESFLNKVLEDGKAREDDSQPGLRAGDSGWVFTDIFSTHWAYFAIDDLYDNRIISGVGNKKFAPDKNVTRAEFAAMMFRLYGPTTITNAVAAVDKLNATQDSEYSSSVELKTQNGTKWYNSVIQATEYYKLADWGTTAIEWEKPISRDEMAYLAIELANKIGNQGLVQEAEVQNLITDYNSAVLSSKYKEQIKIAYSNGILCGDATGKYNPAKNSTRAEAASIIERVFRKHERVKIMEPIDGTKPVGLDLSDVVIPNEPGSPGSFSSWEEEAQFRINVASAMGIDTYAERMKINALRPVVTLRWDDPNRPPAKEGDTFIDQNGKSWKVKAGIGGVLNAEDPIQLDAGREMGYGGGIVGDGATGDGRINPVLGEVYIVYHGHGDWASNWYKIKDASKEPTFKGKPGQTVGYWEWDQFLDGTGQWVFPTV